MEHSGLIQRRVLADARGVASAVDEIARAVGASDMQPPLCVVGIQTGGVYLAKRLIDRLRQEGAEEPPMGVLDITLYRDDIFLGLQQPLVRKTDLPFEVDGASILLVDDVLYTGRTVRAALDALVEFGRPRVVRLAVLVDRGLREYPIQADWVGLKAGTSPDETVRMELVEMGFSEDRVVIYAKED